MREELGLKIIEVPNPIYLPIDGNPNDWADAFLAYSEIQPSEKRLKQWVRYLASKQSISWWDEIKGLGSVTEILNHLRQLPEAQSSASPEGVHL